MKIELIYESGQTYSEYIRPAIARIGHNDKEVIVRFKRSNSEKPSAKFRLANADAQRLAYALLLASSTLSANAIEFVIGEKSKPATSS
jgi:hypothetical protein